MNTFLISNDLVFPEEQDMHRVDFRRLGLVAISTFVLTWTALDVFAIVCHDVIFAQILFCTQL